MCALFQFYMCFISVLYLLHIVRNRLNYFLITGLSYCPHCMSLFSLDYVHMLYSESTCVVVSQRRHCFLRKCTSTEGNG